MKTAPKLVFGLAALFAAVCCALAQSYSVDWYKVAGGGGTSTGGVFSVSGTIGQPDAGAMSGGSFSLQGGFWGMLAAIQTSGAPFLSVTRSNNLVIVSWPLPANGWLLERTNALPPASGSWSAVPAPYQTNATTLSVTFTNLPPAGNQFFRLHKP
jgi:hypothetical protein